MRSFELMRKYLAVLVQVLLMSMLPFAAVHAQDDSTDTGYAIAKLSSPAAIYYRGGIGDLQATAPDGGRFDPTSPAYAAYREYLEDEQANFADALALRAPDAAVIRSFHATANAVVVELNGLTPAELGQIAGVKDVYEVALYQPTMDRSVELIGVPPAWSDAAVGGREAAGTGIRIGIIDSGIVGSLEEEEPHDFFWCKTPEAGGIFASGVTGEPANDTNDDTAVDPSPGEAHVNPHGTHVAGTSGGCIATIGNGSLWDGTMLSGVAPGSTLVDYNVFPGIGAGWVAFGGSALSHDIADAIETAVHNGDRVINMSLGGGVEGPHDFLAESSNAAVAAGVVVVTSAGNSGPDNFTVGSPGSAADVITVGATTNARRVGILVTVPGFDPQPAFGGEFPDFDGSDMTLVDWPGSDNLACSSDVADGSLNGEVVLIERGECTFSQKVHNAYHAGAGGVIIFTDDRPAGGMARTDGYDDELPAVMVARPFGLNVEEELGTAGSLFPTVITPPMIIEITANELAGFSSRGPAPFTGIVKPDVVAPGVYILSSVFDNGWALFNGTSMASPHVAGSSAVLLQANPDWTPAQVKSALATTATDLGKVPWEQGSGLINVEAALNTNAFFTPTNASFGLFEGNSPANGSVDISIEPAGVGCSLNNDSVLGDYVTAAINGDVLEVDFTGGLTAPAGLHGGYIYVDCDGQSHTIPWGAVIEL